MSDRRDVKDGAVAIAKSIIEEVGLDGLSLREVARRLGVSHYAPYKHFPTREHLLAEVIRQTFDDFASALRKASDGKDAQAALAAMGTAYVTYALKNPFEYRLMFGTTLPDPSVHVEMMRSSDTAYALLVDNVRRLPRSAEESKDLALFIWSSLHGMVTIITSDVAAAMRIKHSAKSASQFILRHLEKVLGE